MSPGAFSSNKGKDFRSVLEEIARIKDSSVSIPMPEKWKNAGSIMGDDYSISWRVLDAQYFGVPQRRKRIYLVADFGGDTAQEILFEQDSLRGDSKESCKKGKGTACSARDGSKETDREIRCFDIGDRRRVADQSEMSPTLTQKMGTGGNNVPIILENHAQDSRVDICKDGTVPTLTTRMGTGGGNVPMVMEPRAFHLTQDPISMKISPCLTQGNPNAGQATIGVVIPIADKATRYQGGGNTRNDDGASNGIGVGDEKLPSYTLTYAMQGFGDYKSSDTASSIKQRDFKDATDLVVAFEPGTVSRIGGHFYEDGKTGTLRAKPGDNQQAIISEYIVRRLTPTECGRLQGFPDGWADNLAIEPTVDDILYWKMVFKEHSEVLGVVKKEKTDNQIRKWLQNPESDSAKYKMWGNGIALPCAVYVMQNIAKHYREEE